MKIKYKRLWDCMYVGETSYWTQKHASRNNTITLTPSYWFLLIYCRVSFCIRCLCTCSYALCTWGHSGWNSDIQAKYWAEGCAQRCLFYVRPEGVAVKGSEWSTTLGCDHSDIGCVYALRFSCLVGVHRCGHSLWNWSCHSEINKTQLFALWIRIVWGDVSQGRHGCF